jgi:hypothetical protein
LTADLIPFAFEKVPFTFQHLWLPTACILSFGYLISLFVLKNITGAIILALIKALAFFSYFFFIFNGTYTSGFDDYYYISKGLLLIRQVQEQPIGNIDLFAITGSFHFMYVIVSAISQYCFGEDYYFSLVAMNVIISFLCGYFAYAIIRVQYQNDNLSWAFFVVMVMYPDLLLWSSVYAGKDTLILLGHLIFIYAYSNSINNHKTKGTFLIILAVFLTLYLRFYIVPIFLLIIFLKIKKQFPVYIFSIALIILAAALDLFSSFSALFQEGTSILTFNVLHLPYDILHFWLTPRPFHEDSIHGFLLPANLFNWLCFPIIFLGFLKCIRSKDRFARFLSLYFSVFSIFYGIVAYLNGPRHRLQLIFAIIYFLWVGLSRLKFFPKNLRLSDSKRFTLNSVIPAR